VDPVRNVSAALAVMSAVDPLNVVVEVEARSTPSAPA
jgi:hypothetical protein